MVSNRIKLLFFTLPKETYHFLNKIYLKSNNSKLNETSDNFIQLPCLIKKTNSLDNIYYHTVSCKHINFFLINISHVYL